MAVHQAFSARRLSRDELRAKLEHARERIADLEADGGQSHERLIDTLAEHLHDGFSLLSPDGVHLDVNPAFCAMVGYKREELADLHSTGALTDEEFAAFKAKLLSQEARED